MDKTQLLELEKNSHLTIAELREADPDLASPLGERLEKRAHREALSRLAGSSDTLRRVAESIRLPLGATPNTMGLRASTLMALREAVTRDPELAADRELAREIETLETATARPTVPGARPEATLAETLRLDEPLAFNPEFRRDLDAARLYRLSDATGLGDSTTKVLIDRVGSVSELSGDRLAELVTDRTLTVDEARAAGLAGSLYHVLDERPELVAKAREGAAAIHELAELDTADWERLVTDSGTTPPGGVSAKEYAELLSRKVARLFPTDALAHRLGNVEVASVVADDAGLRALRALNPGVPIVGAVDFGALKTEGISPDELGKLGKRHEKARTLANRYPGMRLATVLDDGAMSPIDKEREVSRRTQLATNFFKDNADVLGADLTLGSADIGTLTFAAGASDQDKAMVLANARTYQRAMTIAEDIADADALVAGGFGSAMAVATTRADVVAARTGLKSDVVARYQEKAKRVASGVTAQIGSLIDIVKGGFKDTGVGNVSPQLLEYIKEIPGFEDFFGNQDYCNCDHCSSILSPAAYFVDLMTFVDEHVTQTTFAAKPNHPLKLQNRRPDLWTIELTCANTNTPIPYLVIINEILENAVAKDAGFAGNFADRLAVGTKVYKDTLTDRLDSFAQPLNLAFEELRTYLRHFERNLADMAEAGGATGETLARLRLALPPKDYQLVTQPNANLPFLRRVYGIQFTDVGGTIQKFDAQTLLKPLVVTRVQLGELVASQFATADGALSIRITGEKRSAESVQNDIENVSGLTAAALDRIHRFVRLWRATGWRIGELDLVLRHLKQAGIGAGIDPVVLQAVAHLHRLQTRHAVSVEEFVALWSSVPQQPVTTSAPETEATGNGSMAPSAATASLARLTTPLFDRLFNQARFVETGGSYPQPAATFLHPGLATVAAVSVDPNLHRLQTGTGTDEASLLQLIVGLARPLGIDPLSNDDAKKKFALTLRNLSLLYRHARLARLLRMSIPELFALAGLASDVGSSHVETLSDLSVLLELHAWWKTTKLSVSKLVQIVRPGWPAVMTSAAAVAGTAGGEIVAYTATIHGDVKPLETIALGANADLPAVIAQWNGIAQHTEAFRADAFGTEMVGGTFLGIRTRDASGPDSGVQITADSASLFAAALPTTSVGAAIPSLSAQNAATPAALVLELMGQVRQSNALIFADTSFALLRATPPVATSGAPVPSVAAGASVACTVVLGGGNPASETINFAAGATLDAGVADWNAKAQLTKAFRSDAAGTASALGTHLSVTVKAGAGSNTRLRFTADSAAIFTTAPPLELQGAELTEDQSRALVAANSASVELADAEGRYRLKSGFDPDVPVSLPAGIDAALAAPIQEAFRSYHGKRVLLALLPGKVGVAPEILPQLIDMLGVDLDENNYFLELRDDAPPDRIAALIARLTRLASLFTETPTLDSANLEFIRTHASLFGVMDFDRLSITSIRRIERFRAFVNAPRAATEAAPDLQALVLAFDPVTRFASADQDALAALLGQSVGLVESMHGQIALAATPLEALGELQAALALARHVGISGTTLKMIQSVGYDGLASASAAIQAAFRAKYDDEAEWQEKIQPFRDALLSRRRDGLVAYLVHSGGAPFDEVSDLYHYYLLDVQVEGCMRTSRVAAAIDSVQLYVHRILMNLEETPPGAADPAHVLPERIPDEEWEWRMAYRTWEANRRIFLNPQDYLEPGLRDDKTPLFETLEEELLSKEVTNEAILEAYERYLRGFDELAHLTIAGSYHEKDEAAKRDVLHLLGVTSDDPPIFYYRRVEDAHYGAVSDQRATYWGAWEKLNIQVPVRKVAPLIHNGQLYVFWIRYVTKVQNRVSDGESKFTGYQHRAYVEFSRRRLDGSWTSPQKLRLDESPFGPAGFPESYQDDGVVLDPIVPKSSNSVEILWFDFTFYSNFEPLYDSRQHEVPKDDYTPTGYQWDQLYPASSSELSIRGVNFQMWSPVDLYGLKIGEQYTMASNPEVEGVPWLNPAIFILIWVFSGGQFDLTALLPSRLVWSRKTGERRDLHSTPSLLPCFDTYTYASLLIDEARFKHYDLPLAATDPAGSPGVWTGPQWDKVITDYLANVTKVNRIADVPGNATLDVVNGSVGDVVIQTTTDAFYLQSEARDDGKYHLRRLNTSLSADIADLLFNKGLEKLLATETQLGLKEHATTLNLDGSKINDATKVGEVDFRGAMGTYLREIFFQIPFLIANHLNSQGRYADAQHWYHYIFDPTSTETIQGLPAGLSPEERRRRELDRNWRYREFRGLTLDTLRAQLTDETAIEKYKRDPFNPHAIARLRTSAYQKAILMKYVDNLLDWGDDLFVRAFAQLNPEYLRQATLKYITAQEILGDRPAQLGDCGEGKLRSKVYPEIRKALDGGSEFLIELESIIATRTRVGSRTGGRKSLVAVTADRGARATRALYVDSARERVVPAAPAIAVGRTRESVRELIASAPASVREAATKVTVADAMMLGKGSKPMKGVSVVNLRDSVKTGKKTDWITPFGWSFLREVSPIFCIPGSEKMLGYWDRVEDRLYKLRHCQDIDGVFRLLPLFAPKIDPGLLVGGKAGGLSLDDILTASGGNLPPYRFRYLVDKAKGFTSIVQGFGAALLSALEKRDAEELGKLRNVHQKNILALTMEVRRNELKIAEESLVVVERRQTAAQYRKDYYEGLISTGLISAETDQYAAHQIAAALKGSAAVLDTLAGIAHLIPQLGSPFAMKYGGLELGSSSTSWSQVLGRAAGVAEAIASSRGMDASFERREDGWDHQKKLAAFDLKAIEKELAIAGLRKSIATRTLLLHEKATEQHDEIMEFFADRFSNLGLYTQLSRSLQQLHREAYNNAIAIARLAEQAYRFERPGDSTTFVGGEWDAARSGLLAGERLLMALHNMDKRFIETNTQQSEINQTFSVAQIDPEAIIQLKETGSCEFSIPEFYFDMFYPGHYRRRVRAVRLTIPAITGPYTNISAKLTLLSSNIRKEATLGAAHLFEVPTSRASSVAMSTGQGDAGVFELNFRDEKYMPFEGSGAVSTWRLELPSTFRPFDYQSINDVMLNISYTALEDGAMRQQVESQNAALEGSLVEHLTNNPGIRVFSLRQEFSSAFNRLAAAAAGTPVTIDITDRHFPLFLQGRALTPVKATLVLAVADRGPVGAVSVSVNGTVATGFPNPTDPPAPGDAFGGLPTKALAAAFAGGLKKQHTITINDAGSLAAPAGAGSLFAPDKLRDILLVIEYRV